MTKAVSSLLQSPKLSVAANYLVVMAEIATSMRVAWYLGKC